VYHYARKEIDTFALTGLRVVRTISGGLDIDPVPFMCFVFMWNPLQIWELCNPGILSEFAMQPAFNMGLLLFILAALPALVIWIGVRLRRFLLTDFIMVIIAAIAMVTTIFFGREDHGSLYGPWDAAIAQHDLPTARGL
jgi:hypothetical protein